MTGFTYLATPYTSPDPQVRHQRYIAACRAAAHLMQMGKVVFSPIAHSHPIEVSGIGEQMSGAFWKRQDIPVLRHASELVVLMLDGWTESSGIRWEIETAEALDIPVTYMEPLPDFVVPHHVFDLVAHLHRQRDFSLRTFGPGKRVNGVTDHIAKELIEIRESDGDLKEWIDSVILSLDGCWRSGATLEEIIAALIAKQTKNEGRTWPDWRTAPPDTAIEHVQSAEVA